MRKQTLVVVPLAALIVFVSACGDSDDSSSESPAESPAESAAEATTPPTISDSPATTEGDKMDTLSGSLVITAQAGPPADYMATAVEAFNAVNPDVDVTLDTVTYDFWRNNSPLVMGSDDAPDVAYFNVDARIYPELVANDILMPLDDVWEASDLFDAYPEATVNAYTATDGQVYGVNVDVIWTPVVYYNKDLFQQAGVVAPEGRFATMEDWYAATDALEAAGIAPLSLGMAGGYSLKHLNDQLLQTAAEDDETFNSYLYGWKDGQMLRSFDEDGFLAATSMIQEWQERGVFAEGSAATDNDQSNSLFLAGQVAMTQSGSWGAGVLGAEEPDFEMGWFLYPPIDPARPTQFLSYNGNAWGIPAKADNPENAKAFLEFITSYERMLEISNTAGVIPPRTDIDPFGVENLPPMVTEQLALLNELGVSSLWADSVPAELGEGANVLLQAMIVGQETPESVGQELQTTFDELVAGG